MIQENAVPGAAGSNEIRQERIVTLNSAKSTYTGFWTVLTLSAIMYVFGCIINSKNGQSINWTMGIATGVISLVIGLVFIFLLGMFTTPGKLKRYERQLQLDYRKRFASFIGKEPKYIDVGITLTKENKHTCTGIAYSDGRLYIVDDGIAAELPWYKIRSWSWSIAGLNEVFTVGLSDLATNLAVNRRNIQAAGAQIKSSGFFVTVQDIDKPEWRFKTTDEAACMRWQEIITQMNEGGLATR